MTLDQLVDRLPLLTGVAFAIGILLVFISTRYFRRSRRAAYWTQRRSAGQRGFRIVLLATFFFTISAIFCGLTFVGSYIDEPSDDESTLVAVATTEEVATLEASPTAREVEPTEELPSLTPLPIEETVDPTLMPSQETLEATFDIDTTEVSIAPTEITATATEAPTATATNSPTATATPSETATDAPTETLPPSPTPTLEPSPTATDSPLQQDVETSVVRVIASRTPSPNANLSFISVSDTISNQLRPASAATEFTVGFNRIYAFIEFESMASGVIWTRELVHNDQVISRQTSLWGTMSSGESMFFFADPNGFRAGDYEIRIYLGDSEDVITSLKFSIAEL